MIDKNNHAQKRWFGDGATMAYSIRLRMGFWFVDLVLYSLLNMFYLRIQRGTYFSLAEPFESGELIAELLNPLNIFQFPGQIFVTGLIMALLCTVPILISQLYSLLHSLPFFLAVFFLGHNPILCLCLFVSCALAGFEPLRFKSKFVAAVLCLLPEVLYWVLYSGKNPEENVLRWAVLYAPWALAFLISVAIFGLVLMIGHFLRYRPGVLMPIFALLLAGTVLLFHFKIGMDERAFQANVSRWNPKQIPQFHNRSIVPLLEEELAQRRKKSPYLTDELIMTQLRLEWRGAFLTSMPSDPTTLANREVIKFYQAKVNAVDHIQSFIEKYPEDERVADALYYKALLFDLSVDLRALRSEDTLRFYYDIPTSHSEKADIWAEILERFADSDVAIEARWRLARLGAGRKPKKNTETFKFNQALELLNQAKQRCEVLLQQREKQTTKPTSWTNWLGSVFRRAEPTLTSEELLSLQQRIGKLMMVIDKENRTGHLRHEERLAEFVGLDPHQLNYEERLKALLFDSPEPDPLIDNIELAKTLLIQDNNERIAKLTELITRFEDRDGGIQARLELALTLLAERKRSEYRDTREVLLARSREQLKAIIKLRPDSVLAQYAQELLKANPLE